MLVVAGLPEDLERGLDIRRYDQFEAMAQVFDPEFDNKVITDYGCNCPALGDRPLSDPGKGAPVDQLDKVCQKFKRCTKCAKLEFGEDCISEMIRYKFVRTDATCTDKASTCERALCECDRMFAFDLATVDKSTIDANKWGFFSDFDRDEDCIRGGGGGNSQCCWNGEGPFTMYNASSKQCCANGRPISFGKTCDDRDDDNETSTQKPKPTRPYKKF